MEPQALRAAFLGAEQGDIRDLRHIHQAVARRTMDFVERDPKLAPLRGTDVEHAVESVTDLRQGAIRSRYFAALNGFSAP